MSLVGSEVSISGTPDSQDCASVDNDAEKEKLYVDTTTTTPPSTPPQKSAAMISFEAEDDECDDDDDDLHPSLSPPRSAESLFIGNSLASTTSRISAAALAQQIHLHHAMTPSSSMLSVATDDFHSAYSQQQRLNSNSIHGSDPVLFPCVSYIDDDNDENSTLNSPSSVFDKDALSRDIYLDSSSDPHRFHDTTNNMSTTAIHHTEATSTTPISSPAEKTYEMAKGIWGWGKGVIILRPFLGMAEGVAGKAVAMAGSSLPEVDGNVAEKLTSLDQAILNPAIAALVEAIMGAAHSTHDFVQPMVLTLLKPLDFMLKHHHDDDAAAAESSPEVTSSTMPVRS